MVKLSFRQTIVVIVLAAALLVALLGGLLRSATMSGRPSATPHSTHPPLAWYCPAPPVAC